MKIEMTQRREALSNRTGRNNNILNTRAYWDLQPGKWFEIHGWMDFMYIWFSHSMRCAYGKDSGFTSLRNSKGIIWCIQLSVWGNYQIVCKLERAWEWSAVGIWSSMDVAACGKAVGSTKPECDVDKKFQIKIHILWSVNIENY